MKNGIGVRSRGKKLSEIVLHMSSTEHESLCKQFLKLSNTEKVLHGDAFKVVVIQRSVVVKQGWTSEAHRMVRVERPVLMERNLGMAVRRLPCR